MNDAATALETIELHDAASSTRALIAPARGGLVTRFSVGGRELLFLDEATLLDPSKNVRGGVPVLFPSPGKLAGGRFARAGRSGAMGQHGFARAMPWQVEAQREREVVLRLESTSATLAVYPWPFLLRYRFALVAGTPGAALRIEQEIANTGPEPMPFACGFHPYFFVPQAEKAQARIETGATRALDNTTGRQIALPGPIDLTQPEVDLHLIDHARSDAALLLADGSRIELRCSPEFQRWVVWTLAGKEFVCLEPWSAPADALNTGASLLTVEPGATRTLWTELRRPA